MRKQAQKDEKTVPLFDGEDLTGKIATILVPGQSVRLTSKNPCVRVFGLSMVSAACGGCKNMTRERDLREEAAKTSIICDFRTEAGFPYSVWPDKYEACARFLSSKPQKDEPIPAYLRKSN